ncbi:MAG: hypothetical protein DHS20C08_02490 [Rhodomicrobium sp.]|nr:MAG: hypothetical protein DHS20C08_02490 [Rhodomicrobium sp.]
MTNLALSEQPDYTAIKTKQNAAWSSGDYAKVGITLQLVGEELAEAMALPFGSRALDVAAGNGNATLAMARRWYKVTSTDYVADLLARGRARAEAEGLDVDFQVADAEALPFEDGQFDAVVSTYGVMFTPNQSASAQEMNRVCRSGGRIGLANWTPESFIGQLFKTLGKYLPPPPGLQSPARWGTKEFIEAEFGADAADISMTLKQFNFRYQSPQQFIDFFRTWYGPVHKAFLALNEEDAKALEAEMMTLIESINIATDGSAIIPADYQEILITKR